MDALKVGTGVFAALLLTCCSVIESGPIDPTDQRRAAQASGSYFLPKQILHVVLTRSAAVPDITVTPSTVPDPRAHLQVGFGLSPTSDDNIQVDYESGMLKSVSADAADRTADIIVNLAKDAALFRTEQALTPKKHDITVDFDPFDYDEAARTNAKLGIGNCVEVEVSPGVWSPGCGKYSLARGAAARISEDDAKLAALPTSPGLYYRRVIPHVVHTVLGGQTVSMESKPFANNSPILRIDVNRTLFVDRKTTLAFDKGELTQVIVKKDSELLAISKLPVDIVTAYTGQIVASLTQQKSIVDAQAALLNSQASSINAATALQKAAASTSPSTTTTSTLLLGAAATPPAPPVVGAPAHAVVRAGGEDCLGGLAPSGTCH